MRKFEENRAEQSNLIGPLTPPEIQGVMRGLESGRTPEPWGNRPILPKPPSRKPNRASRLLRALWRWLMRSAKTNHQSVPTEEVPGEDAQTGEKDR